MIRPPPILVERQESICYIENRTNSEPDISLKDKKLEIIRKLNQTDEGIYSEDEFQHMEDCNQTVTVGDNPNINSKPLTFLKYDFEDVLHPMPSFDPSRKRSKAELEYFEQPRGDLNRQKEVSIPGASVFVHRERKLSMIEEDKVSNMDSSRNIKDSTNSVHSECSKSSNLSNKVHKKKKGNYSSISLNKYKIKNSVIEESTPNIHRTQARYSPSIRPRVSPSLKSFKLAGNNKNFLAPQYELSPRARRNMYGLGSTKNLLTTTTVDFQAQINALVKTNQVLLNQLAKPKIKVNPKMKALGKGSSFLLKW